MLQPSSTQLELKLKNGIISYNDIGDKNLPVLIFIHGFPFDKNMWDGQLEALSTKHRCIAFDLPGYGQSERVEELSIEYYADVLDAFMHLMQIESATICGLSMGGYISLRAIVKYPHRFIRLILCDTQCIADTEEGRKKRFSTIEAIEKDGLGPFAEGFIKNLFTERNLQANPDFVQKIKSTILSSKPESVTATLKALAERIETCSNLGEIKIPTLIICGEEDKITTVKQSQFMNEHIQGSKLVILNDAAHLSNLEQESLFNKSILNFLG